MTERARVIKLGGSLLAWPDWATSFRRWLALQPAAANIVVVGGGPLAEALRELDQANRLPTEKSHWLAVGAMSLTAALAAAVLPEAALVQALDELCLSNEGVQILDVGRFLREDAAGVDPLPCGWDVTSDSIAARVAGTVGAQELVLMKSTLPPGQSSREALAKSGFVDVYFPRAAKGLAVRCVDLRSSAMREVLLR
jgi:aspartokinase-like uncharacterized kinase